MDILTRTILCKKSSEQPVQKVSEEVPHLVDMAIQTMIAVHVKPGHSPIYTNVNSDTLSCPSDDNDLSAVKMNDLTAADLAAFT